MNLVEKIMKLYPELTISDFMGKIIIQNDGDERGDYLAKWEHPTLPCPTEQQLAEIE